MTQTSESVLDTEYMDFSRVYCSPSFFEIK